MTGHCTCGRRVYLDERIGSHVHVELLPSKDWHPVDLAPSTARTLHPAGSTR